MLIVLIIAGLLSDPAIERGTTLAHPVCQGMASSEYPQGNGQIDGADTNHQSLNLSAPVQPPEVTGPAWDARVSPGRLTAGLRARVAPAPK